MRVNRVGVSVLATALAFAGSLVGPALASNTPAGAAPAPAATGPTRPGPTTGMALRTDGPHASGTAAAPLQRTAGSNAQSPAPNPGSDLTHHGTGNIMPNPVIYNVFWLPAGFHYESDGLAASDTRYENLINRFAMDVGGNDFYNVVTQYPGNNGTPANAVTFGGSTTDTTAYPHAGTQGDPIFDADIQAAATRAATNNSWTTDINHIYMVYTGFNVFECTSAVGDCNYFPTGHVNAFCAYHSAFGGGPTIYSFMGDDGMFGNPGGCSTGSAPNGDPSADAEISTFSHEFIEAVTDPNLNAWFNATGAEIGDLCNRFEGPRNLLAPGADVYLNGHPYAIQQEWSNAVHGCAMDLNAAKNSIVPPILTVAKLGDPTVFAGNTINYSVTATNPSNTDAATLLTITDTLPAGVTYVGGSAVPTPSSVVGQTLTWNLGTLAVHDHTTMTFRATAPVTAVNVHNCATAAYDDALQISAQPTVNGCADTRVVVCTRTIGATLSPSLVAGSTDVLCLNGTTVNGSVVGATGSVIAVNGGYVAGSITGGGMAYLSVCAATVKGSVSSAGATGFVRIGDVGNDDGLGCTGNNIGNQVAVTSSAFGVEVSGNQIKGNLTVNDSHGALGEDVAAEIESNAVGGQLTCQRDVPAATADGHPNTVVGSTANCTI